MMQNNTVYYLKSCLRHLKELSDIIDDTPLPSLGGEALADNIDWLDCYIDKLERAALTPKET